MLNKTINGYSIKHLIGSGGMADVYYAENKLGKKAAIKVLKSELCAISSIKERFEQEARIMVDLEHKHIRLAYDLDEVNGQPAIVMEYLEGQTLKQLIDKGKISDEKAKKYFEQCVSALKAAHEKEIVHRDIKPSNIFITRDDEVKILDFGIAKVAESGLGTRTNQMLGTPVYMSPEQIKSPKNVGTKSDVYSLAVTFYHALTGKVPYDSTTDSNFEIQSKIVHEDLDLNKVSSLWGAILNPMLIKDSNQRIDINMLSVKGASEDATQYDSETEPNQGLQIEPNNGPDQIAFPKWMHYLLAALIIGLVIATYTWYVQNVPKTSLITHNRPNIKMITIPGKNFQLSETEVTIGQYLAFCKAANSHWPVWLEKGNVFNIYSGRNDIYKRKGVSESNTHYPITGVSALDADAFCKWMGGRLPTEQEWEYAAKGGENYEYAGSDNIDAVAWYDGNSDEKTHSVKQKRANGYGLYDMSGNVWEWTSSNEGGNRVLRGGCSYNDASSSGLSTRNYDSPDSQNTYFGFRLAAPSKN